MKPHIHDNSQLELFRNSFQNQLNLRHPMVVLSNMIGWKMLEEEMGNMHEDSWKGGQPPKPVRLIVGIMLLQYMHNLSDEEVVRRWAENPYWQYFCGYDSLQWECPIDPSSLTRWRGRIGSEKMEKILAMTVTVAVDTKTIKKKDLEKVIVDTTIMPKNITYPTDSKLQNKSRQRIVKIAKKEGIKLRQNYNEESKKLMSQLGRYMHAKQMKRAAKLQKRMKTILGRVKRDFGRQIERNPRLQSLYEKELIMAEHLLTRKKKDKNKVYSLHEPHVVCISKGKAQKLYEFGAKVAISVTHKKGIGIITGCESKGGNPYDGHTLATSLELSERITGVAVKRAFVDKGYKGHTIENVEVYQSGQKRGVTPKIKKEIKRRQAIEPHIGHMKQKVKLGLSRLKGILGDQINAILAAAAYNLRQVLRHIRCSCAFFIVLILEEIYQLYLSFNF